MTPPNDSGRPPRGSWAWGAWRGLVIICAACVIARAHSAQAGLNVWTTNGPGHETILSLAIDPVMPMTLYAGTENDGVFRSPDGGTMWSAAGANMTDSTVRALAIDPRDPRNVYAGTLGGGVFKSIDGGDTWTAFNNGLIGMDVLVVAIDPITPRRVYAGTGGGVFAIEQIAPTPTPTPTPTATPTAGGGGDDGGGCSVTPNVGGVAWWLLVPAIVLAWARRRQRG